MQIRKLAATATLAIASLGIATGTAYAAPAPAPAASQTQQGIGYTAGLSKDGNSVVFTTNSGSLDVAKDGNLEVRDASGKLALSLPSQYVLGDKAYKIATQVKGNTATITPQTDPAKAIPVQKAGLKLHQVDSQLSPQQQKHNEALAALTTQLGAATAVGGLIGTIIGAVVGGLTTGIGFLPGAAIGGVIGTIAVGGPALIGSAIEYFQTVNG